MLLFLRARCALHELEPANAREDSDSKRRDLSQKELQTSAPFPMKNSNLSRET
jgi:hypothetical protein